MQETEYIWQNNKFIPWQDAKTHVLTHALHYGSAAFEGMRVYLTDKGPAIFRLSEHLERFFYSASAINMQLPYSEADLTKVCLKLIALNKCQACYIRPIAFYGYGKLGVNPVGAPIEVVIACWPWDVYLPYKQVAMKTSKYIRVPANVSLPNAKLSGNYLNGIFGLLELQGTDYQEALFLDTNGYIAEGSGENIFIIKNNVLYTPKLGSILPGISRDTILAIAKKIGIKSLEKDLTLEEAYQADEAFLTGTAIEVMPIKSIDDKTIGNGKIGPITKKFKQYYLDIVQGKVKDFASYLTWTDTEMK